MPPSVGGGFGEVVIVLVASVRPVVASQVMPEILDGVEFRRVWRHRDQGDVRRNLESLGGMVAGLVPNQDGVNVGSQFVGELLKEVIDDGGIQMRRQQSDALTGAGANRSQYIEVIVLRLSHGPWPRALFGPYAGQRSLLPEARFILEPDFDSLVGMGRTNDFHLLDDVFLKALWASGSLFLCLGRGMRQL